MKKIKLMNKIASVGTDVFDRSKYEISDTAANPDAIMVRSANLHEMEFNKELLAVARAGAGVNNIPIEKCSEMGIAVFNTPGANANGVKELAIAALILAARDVVGGIDWAKTLMGTEGVAKAVEKGKSAFAGNEIMGKTLGVIGLGAIGGMVANSARHLGMNVIGCDPYLTVNAAWSLSSAVRHADGYDEIYKNADYITLHLPSTPQTRGMINAEAISKMKDGVKIINLARADLAVTEDIKAALECGKVSRYVTDFPTEETLGVKNIINIPHLGASTEESEDNCAVMAAKELDDYLTFGNIKNSVNFPAVSIPMAKDARRVCVCHKNIANMLAQMTSAFSSRGVNIENLSSGSRGDIAYTILEVLNADVSGIAEDIKNIEGVIRVRTL